jgi:hypothetical protein
MAPPAGGGGFFVDPNGVLADGSGQPYAMTGDPAVDAALAEAFGAPSPAGSGDQGQDAVFDALLSILSEE